MTSQQPTPEAVEAVAARQWGKSPAAAHPDVLRAIHPQRTLRQDIDALIAEYENAPIDPDMDEAGMLFLDGATSVARRLRSILGRHHAGEDLVFIRDAIHRDGDDADAIRQAIGLEWDEEIKPKGNGIAHFARVVSGWQEVPDGYGE